MPTWTFREKGTTEEWDEFFTSYSAKEAFLEENPHLETIIRSAPALHSGAGLGLRRIDNGFKDLLGRISKNNPGNTIKS